VTRMSDSVEERLSRLSSGKTELLRLLVEERFREAQRIRRFPRPDGADRVRLPTSWAQERLWFIDHLEGASAAYHVRLAMRLRGSLNQDALQKALDSLVQRHEVLRTVFVGDEGEPWQEVAAGGRFALRVIDLSDCDPREREEQLRRQKIEEAEEPFDLSVGPLIRGRLLRLAAEEHVLLITMHHIVSDGWSVGVLIREFAQLYRAFREGRGDPLEPLPIRYADYAQWQRHWLQGEVLNKQLSYWRTRLEGAAPQLELPTDRARAVVQSYRGGIIRGTLDANLSAQLKALAKRHDMTLFMVLYLGWAMLLSRLSGQQDVVIGTPVANRQRSELEGLIGFFVNTLVLRLRVQDDVQLVELIDQVREVTLGAFDHQDTPFEQVVDALQPERSLSRNPLFQVMFVLQNAPKGELELPGLAVTPEQSVNNTSQFDLLLSMAELGDRIVAELIYAADLFDRETVERWMACFQALLKSMTEAAGARVGELPILPESERIRVIELFNATKHAYPENKLVHELFEEQAERTPDAVALLYEGQSLTYSELNSKANQLARYLLNEGVRPDELVGVCVGRSLEMVVALLGILKAGGAYVPLDPNYPIERLQYMLESSAPNVVLTHSELRALLPGTKARHVALDTQLREIAGYIEENLRVAELGLTSRNLVYVIYTSGSTGRPKGTAMSHRSMINLIEWHRRTFRVLEGCRVQQFAALSFDVAFQEIFSTLCTGGTLVLLPEWVRRDAMALTEFLSRNDIQRLFVPPLMLQTLAEYSGAMATHPERLQDVITAGEQLHISPQISEFFGQLRGCRLHNHYGPTETHVVTALTLPAACETWPASPSIGRPISNTQIYVLNGHLQPMPVGVPGEIYIGGAGVARGYLRQPELTVNRFIDSPFSAVPHDRLYKSGDLGRWRADGTLDYLGRTDDQVKIRGYRIELADVEAQLARHAQVKEVVVVAREDVPGEKRLVAYLTHQGPTRPTQEELRTHAKALLPEFMIPSAFVVLNSFPVTQNGKLDRRSLPAPDPEACVSQQYEAPQGPVEQALADLWQELLGVQRVGRHDNFFELGGHSLLALKALFKINQRFGSALKGIDVYKSPTVLELAARIGGDAAADELVDLTKEATLDADIVPCEGHRRVPAQAVLVTGCTGFMGRFLLAQLLEDSEARLYCLVRARSQQHAASRLRTTLSRWDLWREEFARRLVAVPGDLSLPRLGVDEAAYRDLCQDVDSIFHCATSMNHLETYAMAKAPNVGGARGLLKLATRAKPKLINYISTLGVFPPPGAGLARVVDEETSIDGEKHWASRGYAASKWVGEKIFLTAGERGIPCNIFRLGLVWADSQQGRYDELQRGYRILKSSLMAGCGIKDYHYDMAPTPVDYVARAIVFLAARHSDGRGIFHISSPTQMKEGLFERCSEVAGTPLKLESFYDWLQTIKRLHQEGRSLPVVPLIESLFSMDEQSFEQYQRRIRSVTIHFDCTRTHRELEQAGILSPVLNDDLLRLCLESMLSRDAELRRSLGSGNPLQAVRERASVACAKAR
jgi:amino acid adenylation domain-containing protein/thioester reductase-like protein